MQAAVALPQLSLCPSTASTECCHFEQKALWTVFMPSIGHLGVWCCDQKKIKKILALLSWEIRWWYCKKSHFKYVNILTPEIKMRKKSFHSSHINKFNYVKILFFPWLASWVYLPCKIHVLKNYMGGQREHLW